MENPSAIEKRSTLLRIAKCGFLLTIGFVLLVIAPSWILLPVAFGHQPEIYPWLLFGILFGVGLACVGLGGRRLSAEVCKLPEPDKANMQEWNRTRYCRALVGVGCALLLDGLLNLIAFAGFAYSCALSSVFPLGAAAETPANSGAWWGYFWGVFGTSKNEGIVLAVLILVSLGMALLGALFHIANSLWKKMPRNNDETGTVDFDVSVFWAGLWFRIGESFIFTIVAFLILRLYDTNGNQIFLLPLIALVMGMFLKSGEALITGLALRVMESFAQLVPLKPKSAPISKRMITTLDIEREIGATEPSKLEVLVRAIKGVVEAVYFPDEKQLRVQYESDTLTTDAIIQELQLRGFAAK